jgi:hypothetical protein
VMLVCKGSFTQASHYSVIRFENDRKTPNDIASLSNVMLVCKGSFTQASHYSVI